MAGAAGAATGGLVAAGAAAAVVGTAWAIEGGVNAASHMLGWGAETGGGTDSDASRPSRATDVQTLNGMQESGAIDHFFAQQLRRQPQVYRIDTDSESEPQAQPRQQIRARPIRRQGQGRQQPTPFGINQVPIPAQSYKDVLMAPTLIGMFQAGKFLPPQLNLVLELEFAEPADALRPGGGSTDYSIENVRVLASQVTLDSALYESYQKILLSGRSLVFAYPTMHTQVSGFILFNLTSYSLS